MQVHTGVLKNKLKTLVVHDKDSVSVTIMVLVRVGSRFETPEISGLAHFVEHTIFKGTKKRPSTALISTEVEMLGAEMNAFTSHDYTGYYIKVPKENFEKAIEVLADMFLNSQFREEEIEKERGVIIEEKRMYEDQPMDKVSNVFYQHLFKGHSLSREIVGEEETIKAIKRQDFLNFLAKHYGAKNTVVVVSGGVAPVIAEESIQANFGSLDMKSFSEIEEFKPGKLDRRIYNLYKPISQSHLILGGFAPGRHAENKYVIKVANTIFGKGFGSRLFQVIRDKLGLAYYVYSRIEEFSEVGAMNIGMGVENSKIQLAIDAVKEQMDAIAKGDFSQEELERAQNYIIGNLAISMEATDDAALWHGLQLLLDEKILTVDDVKSKIKSVSKEEIMHSWSNFVAQDNLIMASVTPHKQLNINL